MKEDIILLLVRQLEYLLPQINKSLSVTVKWRGMPFKQSICIFIECFCFLMLSLIPSGKGQWEMVGVYFICMSQLSSSAK